MELRNGKTPAGLLGDLVLIARVLDMQRRISRGSGRVALELLDCPVSVSAERRSAKQIERIVHHTVRGGGLLGLLNSCLTRSVIRCRLMRESGIDARVVFGLDKSHDLLSGHCWVVWPGCDAPALSDSNYMMIEIFPSPRKFPGWTPD